MCRSDAERGRRQTEADSDDRGMLAGWADLA
jgi:hypothetical protein